jgi:UMF1 family MFS transporter
MWPFAILLYAIAVVGFSGGNIFYDALLVIISPPSKRHRISALGFALGYLGGGLLFLVNVLMYLLPHRFGLTDGTEAIRWSFITVALWWGVFSIPILLWVDEPLPANGRRRIDIAGTFASLAHTARNLRNYRGAWLFLLAYWLYIDGVDTIVRMAVDYGLNIGLGQESLIIALLMVQFIGFPAALIFGRLGDRYGARRGIWIAIWAYVGVTIFAYFMDSALEMYILAAVIGLVQGGIQALSRSMFSQLIPAEKNAEFFGFYNIVGKAAAVFGPFLMGLITVSTGNPRIGILSILILFFAGMIAFRQVQEPDTNQLA